MAGLASRADRPFFSGNTDFTFGRIQDQTFALYERYGQIQRAPPVKYADLKSFVEIDVSFETLPFSHRIDYFNLNQERGLVVLTVEIDNRELTFAPDESGPRAKLAVYGIVTSLSHRISDEFEADLVAEGGMPANRSAYQRILLLERKGRYKLDLVIKDLNSGKAGVRRLALIPPSPRTELGTSSILLSKGVRFLEDAAEADEMFVLGNVHIRPSLDKIFDPSDELHHYLQVYNAAFDHTTMRPSLELVYEIHRDGQTLVKQVDVQGDAIQFLSSQRVVLVRPFSLRTLAPGSYQIVLTVRDLIQDSEVQVTDRFEVASKSGRCVRRSPTRR